MKVILIQNGKPKTVLVPENDFDRAMLKALANQEVETTEILSKMQIGDDMVSEGLIIQPKIKS